MNQFYDSSFKRLLSWKKRIALSFLSLCLFGVIHLQAQNSYTFTPCGATGSVGPSQTQVNNSYSNTNLSGSVTVSGGIQSWTVPVSGGYRIEARGARGFGTNAGRGAIMIGDFTLTAGTVIKILPGQQGAPPISPGTNQYGGGGGSFVTYTNNAALVVAGGGGGSWAQSYTGLSDGTVAANGNSGSNGPTNGTGGTNGGGGGTAGSADGGGGLTGNGAGTTGGLAFTNGATGGALYGHGGFGGGGGGSSWDNRRGCGAGGYSGGGGAGSTTTGFPEGGGGGSINNGSNQSNSSGANNANGRIIITELCNISLTASGSNSLAPSICSGSNVTLTTNGVSNYSWSTGNTTSSVIVVTPTITTTYSLSATSVSACTAFAAITVTVSSGLPVLSVSTSTSNVCLGMSVTFSASGALTYSWTGGVTNGVPFTPSVTNSYTVSGINGCGTTTALTTVTVAPLAVNAISSASSVCAGSSATLSASAAANTYTWLPLNFTGGSTIAVSPQVNTTYTVVVSNGTCNGTGTVAVATVPVPTITAAASSSAFCEGLSATLTANGGNNYVWMPGNLSGSVVVVTPSVPTLYSVTGDNSFNCTGSASQIILVFAAPVLTLTSSNNYVCSGSSVALSVSGADTYSWSNSATTSSTTVNPTQSATYSVTGTNTTSGCSAVASVSVDVFIPTISISGNTMICNGSVANLQASGANSYTWSNGSIFSGTSVTPTVTTIYTVSAIASSLNLNCPASASVQVTVNPSPTVVATANRTLICRNESALITASGANTYSWSNSSATSSTISITPNLVTTLFITVKGTDINGCSSDATVTVKVEGCIGISETEGSANIKVYPNPSAGDLFVELEVSETLKLYLIDQLGKILNSYSLNPGGRQTLHVNNLSPGVYFLSGNNGTQNVYQKIVVTK